jgi:hypothetical protein
MSHHSAGFAARNLPKLLRDAIEVANFPVERKDPSIVIQELSQFLKLERRLSRLDQDYILLRSGGVLFLLWSNKVFVFELGQRDG